MQERLNKFIADNTERWNGLEKQQKIRLVAGVVVLILAIALTLFFTLKPKKYVLLANKDFTVISQAKAALDDAGISSTVTDNGRSLTINQKDVFEARVAVESNPALSKQGNLFTNEDFFSSSGIGVSESVKKEMSRVALQNDLAAIIRRMDGVSDATVILNLPGDSGFLRSSDPATASVFVEESYALDKSQGITIADTVAAGVTGLTRENVVVTNQNMEIIYSSDKSGIDGYGSDYDLELQKKKEIQYNLLTQLKPLYDDVKISINLKLDNTKMTEEEIIYSPYAEDASTGVTSKSTSSQRNATGMGSPQEPGVYSNDNVSETYETGGEGTYSASERDNAAEFKVNETKRVTEKAVGEIVKSESSISINVYNYETITETYARANGLLENTNWETFKRTQEAERLIIDPDLEASLRVGSGIDNLTLVGYRVYSFADDVRQPVDWQQILIFAILAALILMLAYGLIRRSQPDEVIDVEPELSVEDLLVSTQLEEAKEAEAERLKEIDYTIESEVKKQIEKFVDEKPGAVAQLLRNWLQEGWE